MGMFKITLLILNAVLWAWNAIHHPVATKSNHPMHGNSKNNTASYGYSTILCV